MSSRFVVVIELPEKSCSTQVLEHILGQVREFFDRLSSGLEGSIGQRLRVTISPWEAQHRRWARECSVEVLQSSQNEISIPTTFSWEHFARDAALGTSPVQDGGLHPLAQQQGLDGKIVAGRGRDIEQHLAQGVDLEDLDVLFPDHDFRTSSDSSSSPLAGLSHLYWESLEGFDLNAQSIPLTHQLLPPNAASASSPQEIDVGPQIGDETLIRRAANNLAARPISEDATSQGNPLPTLWWETPRSPADYLTPRPDRPSKSHSPSRKPG